MSNEVALPVIGSPFQDTAQGCEVWALIKLAEVAAETYDRIENPGKYGNEGSASAVVEWLPKLRAALDDAGLLRL